MGITNNSYNLTIEASVKLGELCTFLLKGS
jgi:hypothetical protein